MKIKNCSICPASLLGTALVLSAGAVATVSAQTSTLPIATPATTNDVVASPDIVILAYDGEIRHQGELLSSRVDLQFAIYTVPVGGNQIGAPLAVNNVQINNGRIAVDLPFPAEHLSGGVRYLQVSVRMAGASTPAESPFITLSPRKPALFSPVSVLASTAQPTGSQPAHGTGELQNSNSKTTPRLGVITHNTSSAESIQSMPLASGSGPAPDGVTDWQISGNIIYYNGGPVGVGTATPGTSGLFEVVAGSGNAVFGIQNATQGVAAGVSGLTHSPSGRGIYADATSSNGFTFGVYGVTRSTQGRGVFGIALATTGENYGGRFIARGTSGHGVFGIAESVSGVTYGVRGKTNSASGYGGFFEGRGYFSDNVGIGVLNPEATLHVDGIVKAGIFEFTEPKLQIVSIGSRAFIPETSGASASYITGQVSVVGSTAAQLAAPITLPEGASVTSISAVINDTAGTENLVIDLVVVTDSSTSATIASAASAGSGGTASYDDLNPNSSFNTVDNEFNQYYIIARSSTGTWPGANLRLRRVVVRYTLDEL